MISYTTKSGIWFTNWSGASEVGAARRTSGAGVRRRNHGLGLLWSRGKGAQFGSCGTDHCIRGGSGPTCVCSWVEASASVPFTPVVFSGATNAPSRRRIVSSDTHPQQAPPQMVTCQRAAARTRPRRGQGITMYVSTVFQNPIYRSTC